MMLVIRTMIRMMASMMTRTKVRMMTLRTMMIRMMMMILRISIEIDKDNLEKS